MMDIALLVAVAATAAPEGGLTPALAEPGSVVRRGVVASPMQVVSDTEIIIDGVTFESWEEVGRSGYFQTSASSRCGMDADLLAEYKEEAALLRSPGDCSGFNTSVLPEYDPSGDTLRIPVVVHIFQTTSGTGFVPESRVLSQIDVLNEDFNALAGSLGQNGNFANIEFYIAEVNDQGQPQSGIRYYVDNSGFSDNGSYWIGRSEDPDRFLNIYVNNASGALGYVPNLPQFGIAGQSSDRVVCLYSAFGKNAPLVPFNLGRTVTHEVGHYLGLFHTFDGGCGPSGLPGCATSDDLVCDTFPQSQPTFGCPFNDFSCSNTPDNTDNYMNYSDDFCMEQFTPDQVNRMRCTLLNYRPDLFEVVSGSDKCNPADIDESGSITFADVTAFITAFNAEDIAAADADGDGNLTFADVTAFITAFNAGCP